MSASTATVSTLSKAKKLGNDIHTANDGETAIGVAAHLVKPVALDTLTKLLAHLLYASAAAAQAVN